MNWIRAGMVAILLLQLAGCIEEDVRPRPDEPPSAFNADSGQQEPHAPNEPESGAARSGNVTVAASGCNGTLFMLAMPSAAGFPFEAPPGWEGAVGPYIDEYWSYTLQCDRVVLGNGDVYLDSYLGWDAHTNVSSDGKYLEGSWNQLLAVIQMYGEPQMRDYLERIIAPVHALEWRELKRNLTEGRIHQVSTGIGNLTVQDPESLVFQDSASNHPWTHKWVLHGSTNTTATVQVIENIRGLANSGFIDADGTHPVTKWPIRTGDRVQARAIADLVDSSFLIRVDA